MNSNKDTVRGDALATVSPGMLPPPFTVRWSTKSECWVVWMPETNNLLMIDGTFISITGISAAPELPSGWYTVDDLVPGSDSIYLVITITDSTGSATADLSGTQGTSSSGETVYNIKIASMSTDPNTDEKSIEQYTNSSVIMGSGGSGGGVTTDGISINSDGSGKLQIKGFNDGTPASQKNLSEYLQDSTLIPSSGIKIVARTFDSNGNKQLVYIPISALDLSSYAKTGDIGNGTLTLNFGSDSKTFKANQSGNESVTVPAKTLIPGTNIAITVNGNSITISASGGVTSGFTGNRDVLALMRYDISSHQLQAKFWHETWSRGVMTTSVIDADWSQIDGGQAVMETV